MYTYVVNSSLNPLLLNILLNMLNIHAVSSSIGRVMVDEGIQAFIMY
jgi:hypothetical protein